MVNKTAYGVHVRAPVVRHPERSFAIVLLSCHVMYDEPGEPEVIGLHIYPCPHAIDPERPLYHCGGRIPRLISLNINTSTGQEQGPYVAKWEDIYLAHRHSLSLEQF